MPFEGVYVALITPFTREDTVDSEALRAHVDWLIRKGVDGLVAAGTCAEYASLTWEERERVVQTVLEQAGGRVPVLVGVAAPTTAQALYWALHARDHGAKGIMALPPIQYRASWPEVLAYYRALDEVGLPIVVYNNPFDTGLDLTPHHIRELEKLPHISAVKDFSQDVRRVTQLRETCRSTVLAGADDLALESILAGAEGWIAGMANIVPSACVTLFRDAREGRFDAAWSLYRRMLPLLRYDTSPKVVQAIKYGMQVLGHSVGEARPPRLSLAQADRQRIQAVLADLGVWKPSTRSEEK
jgi:4-hydroxy-tetrahydrodipicolinate synthase